jgi:NTE family protein
MSTALVLGGGGVTGIAWEIGILKGLHDDGVDLGAADLIVGTSAGSVVGTVLAQGVDLDDLVASQREEDDRATELGADFDPEQMVGVITALMQGAQSLQEVRARIGAMALGASTVGEEERVSIIASRLPSHDWPDRRLLITAVDTADGEFVVWDRASGVPLVRAVAASCAVPGVWPPVGIDGHRYMDGGVRSTNNADLAAGHDPVVVVAPYTIGLSGTVYDEVAALGDATVEIVTPDGAALESIGPNPLDPARRLAALEAGIRQAADDLGRIRGAWNGAGPEAADGAVG